jgi:MFS family permease
MNLRPNYKWYVVGMLWWISFFNYADRLAIFSVFSLLRYEMCLSKVELGLLGSSFAWVYGLGAPFAGMVIDRIRRKTAILGGLHVWSGICVATAFSRTFRHLLFFRATEGLGETFYYPASVSMISDYPNQRLRGNDRRRVFCRTHRRALWLALVLYSFRGVGNPSRLVLGPISLRAAARRRRSRPKGCFRIFR